MNERKRTIQITEVGLSQDPLNKQVGRGVFNFQSVLEYLSYSLDNNCDDLSIDLSRIGWLSLFDWCIFTSILHGQVWHKPGLKIRLDFLGKSTYGLIHYKDCAAYIRGDSPTMVFPDLDFRNSFSVYRVLNFVKSFEGPTGFDNIARGQIVLTHLSEEESARPGWYLSDTQNTVILPRTNVGSKEMCLLFANRQQIERWRESMATKRVPNAAIFHSEEFWRVLCHELTRNVVEHAKGPGFIIGRVVLPKDNELPRWGHDVYNANVLRQLEHAKEHGFVELCISDTGVGIPVTIENSYRNRYRERHGIDLPAGSALQTDLLKFAFDELGTSKDTELSWITERHALGHMLFIIRKYGGVLTVRSGNAALTYYADAGTFRRCITQLGFEPQDEHLVDPTVPGTHIQLLIPLKSQVLSDTFNQPSLTRHLPPLFHVDYRHPVGPLIPVHDKLGALSMCIEGNESYRFKESTRALARELLQGSHPRNEMLVFDFGEVDWTLAQFETFLFLMQNVLLNRLVLFTQVQREFAELVNSQEDEDAPTYLPEVMRDDVKHVALDREFTEGKFLETYSSLGSLVLALGPDRGEFLFGVRGKVLRAALLELINDQEETFEGICGTYALDPCILEVVLNNASLLFKPGGFKRWQSVFVRGAPGRDDLETQRLRAVTHHFNIVAEHCGAWRGRRNEGCGGSFTAERYYLPTEDVVYSEFFETSRILARERYVMEVAERLIYRIGYGLSFQKLSYHDVDVLASSTTPTVMLAEAIRRAWPADHDGKKPVVIDYGPSLFSGADPAHVPVKGNSKHRAIVVQDLFDEGTLSKKTVALAENQGIEVMFVLSFVRFVSTNTCEKQNAEAFLPDTGWEDVHPIVGKAVHAMIGLTRPNRKTRISVHDWGKSNQAKDYVVDPRSLRPVLLNSLRLESGFSDERSLTKRDRYLKELDTDVNIRDGKQTCRLSAGHFVYGQRHFGVVVDVRSVLAGAIGYKITNWLADVCCDYSLRNVPWEDKRPNILIGDVSGILLPLHSQIHYVLPGLQTELAQRGRRVPHLFLDSTSFGGGVETYDIPYQLQDQIDKAAQNIKVLRDKSGNEEGKAASVKEQQLRLFLIDDAVFSGRTLQTVLNSLAKHVRRSTKKVYGEEGMYDDPIEWIRVFVILNQLPVAQSALWHQLTGCSASSYFRFDEYAPFLGVATFSSANCPSCKQREYLQHIIHRVYDANATHAVAWVRERQNTLVPLTTEAPYFREESSPTLPEPIDVLALSEGGAPDRYKPIHADSAIWRFYELMYLSYPLGDVLTCLPVSRNSGQKFPKFRKEYARFRLAIYDWCIQNWYQVCLYHAEGQVLNELKAEVLEDEVNFVETMHRLSEIIQYEPVKDFVKWVIDLLADRDADRRKAATANTLALDTALTLLFFSLNEKDSTANELLDYLCEKQASMPRKSSFLSILYLRLKRPHVADPQWALSTIAETCFRGRFGDTPEECRTTDHELLGKLVGYTARKPEDMEYRRRLEGSLYAFIAAVENLQPYYDNVLLSSVVNAAMKVRSWLQLPLSQALEDTTPLATLNTAMQDKNSWERFSRDCHMSVSEFVILLNGRLEQLRTDWKENSNHLLESERGMERQEYEMNNPYRLVQIECEVAPDIQECCLMTHIPRLISCLSNIALEPVKESVPFGPSRIVIKPCVPDRPQSLTIEVFTSFGSSLTALETVKRKSSKIWLSLDDLRLFGISVGEPTLDPNYENSYIKFSLIVPVGFENRRK